MNKVPAIIFVLLYLHAPTIWAYTEKDLDETDLYCINELKYDKKDIVACYDEKDLIKEGCDKMETFYTCAWKKDNLQNDDGTTNTDNLKKIIKLKANELFPNEDNYHNYLANESIKACKDVKGSSNGNTAIKIYNCLFTKIGEITSTVKPGDLKVL